MAQVVKHYVLVYEAGADFIEKRAPHRAEHLRLAQESYKRGEMTLAGALGNPPEGSMLVFRGDSPQAAEAFAKADPYVTNGLIQRWHVREWSVVDWATLP